MRAFLSHSSKDKAFVGQVAATLGDAQCEYDERSFEYVMNVQAIRQALDRSDLFVYFLSSRSISATFVSEKQKAALERRGAGVIRRVVVFALDETSYRALPSWLQEINLVQRLSSPQLCARRIQAMLVQLEAEDDEGAEIYLGRDKEDQELAKCLSGAPTTTPVAIHAVGHYGVGRKTFLRHNLQKLFPRRFETFPEITLSANQGVEELYRQLHDIALGGSLQDALRDIEAFGRMSLSQKSAELASLLQLLCNHEEFPIVIDDGGVYTDESDYQPHIKELLGRVDGRGLPVVGFVQTRMMRTAQKQENKRSFHIYLGTFSDETTRQILGLTLKQLDVDYSEQQIVEACKLLDGHPFNIRFAATFGSYYGLDVLIADPIELVNWKRRRAEDFLKLMDFSVIEGDILAALSEYRHLAPEMIFSIVDSNLAKAASALRRLQEFSCVERREGYCYIAPPLRDAVRRDDRFDRSDVWKQAIGRKICESVSKYHGDDHTSIAVLDGAVLAAARGHEAPAYLSALILPSHLLRIARDYYLTSRWGLCLEFCERAWLSRERLPTEGQLELLRLWGLCSVRTSDQAAYQNVLGRLRGIGGKMGERLSYFLEGFQLRMSNRVDDAEKKFMAAWRLAQKNLSVNRELADLLRRQGRYNEAERFAHATYELDPTNPFALDVMAEVLLGGRQQGLQVDDRNSTES